MQATGYVNHHFWGKYCGDIVLEFADESEAKRAQQALGADTWKRADKAIGRRHTSEQLEESKALLAKLGTITIEPCTWSHCNDCKNQETTIDSTIHSVDYGPTFVWEYDDSMRNQLPLPGMEVTP